ncbi:retrovirus-related Pol polyprotein from transposon 297 [Trichonephila clavipes]|nr:retrovirus-related Pol polyprotein from transposon 297 [Trichonephila clavipes]
MTAYHPQTNGLTERFYKTVVDMLSVYSSRPQGGAPHSLKNADVNVEQRNWDTILSLVTFAYSSVKQDTNAFSPFFYVHGRNIETPPGVIFPHDTENHCDNYEQQLITRVEEARQLAKLHILDVQSSNKQRYDKRNGPVNYNVGDLAWVFPTVGKVVLSENLLRRYFGLY